MSVEISELDQMQQAYKTAVEHWVSTIRAEEAIASPAEHSTAQIDAWEAAGRTEEEAREAAKQAKKAYEGALRQEFFNF